MDFHSDKSRKTTFNSVRSVNGRGFMAGAEDKMLSIGLTERKTSVGSIRCRQNLEKMKPNKRVLEQSVVCIRFCAAEEMFTRIFGAMMTCRLTSKQIETCSL